MTAGELAVYHGVQGGRVFARALIVKNPRVTRVVVEVKTPPVLPSAAWRLTIARDETGLRWLVIYDKSVDPRG